MLTLVWRLVTCGYGAGVHVTAALEYMSIGHSNGGQHSVSNRVDANRVADNSGMGPSGWIELRIVVVAVYDRERSGVPVRKSVAAPDQRSRGLVAECDLRIQSCMRAEAIRPVKG